MSRPDPTFTYHTTATVMNLEGRKPFSTAALPSKPLRPVLTLSAITRQFDHQAIPAVDNVSLSLYEGELLGLLGPSGCGKTTLLRLIAGFERPQDGVITLGGQAIAGEQHWLPPEKRGIGMVFQDYALFPHLTVGKNVAFGLKSPLRKRLGVAQIRQRVREVLDLVGLGDLENRHPHQLSGGQQQRVALARALAPHPQTVLLDEPLSNLDAKVRLQLRQDLRDILKAAGASGIFVTHDQEEALSICDRVAVMRDGCLEQVGTPEALYQEPASRFVAEFVTQANFLPAEGRTAGWHTEIGFIEANQAEDGQRADLMVRQEDLTLVADGQGNLTVRDRQFLGRENRYTLRTSSGRDLIVRTPAETALPLAARVRVVVAPDAIRVFPPTDSSFKAETVPLRQAS
ncbi:MAG: ABC transporter ATP-binding protein [Synechococcales bacterium]|nr:ABC transporter ATP-binding protein [Synechococcales bacterium]